MQRLLLPLGLLLLVGCDPHHDTATEDSAVPVWQYQLDSVEQARSAGRQASSAARQTGQHLQDLQQQLPASASD